MALVAALCPALMSLSCSAPIQSLELLQITVTEGDQVTLSTSSTPIAVDSDIQWAETGTSLLSTEIEVSVKVLTDDGASVPMTLQWVEVDSED